MSELGPQAQLEKAEAEIERLRGERDALRLRAELADELAPRLQDAQAERDRAMEKLEGKANG